jgi:hypothetical protein
VSCYNTSLTGLLVTAVTLALIMIWQNFGMNVLPRPEVIDVRTELGRAGRAGKVHRARE